MPARALLGGISNEDHELAEDRAGAARRGSAALVRPRRLGGRAGRGDGGAGSGSAGAGRGQGSPGIEEITVTARKRTENLQQTPISITALNSTDLEDIQARRIEDIGLAVPNLQIEQGYNSAFINVRIRGIGSSDPIVTRDPSVGLYMDGVYIARAYGALLSVSDLSSVEVLRGPQGTLFGKNTTGGAINVISTKPTDEYSAHVEARYGNYNNFETRTTVNIPIRDEFAALRISFATRTRDELTDNKGPLLGLEPNQGGHEPGSPSFEDADDRKLLAGRASLRLNLTDTFEALLIYDQSRIHQRARGGQCRYSAFGDTGRGSTPGGTPTNSLATGQYTFLGPPVPFFGFIPNDGGMNNFSDHRENCELSNSLDEHDFMSNVPLKSNNDSWGTTGIFTWDVTENVTAKYTTSWRRYKRKTDLEFDWTATGEFGHGVGDEEQHDQISHELNLSGTAMDSRLNWTGGLYAFREKTDPGEGFWVRVAQTLTEDWWNNGFSSLVPDENLDDVAPFLFGTPFFGATYAQLGCVSGVICPLIPAPFGLDPVNLTPDQNQNFFGFIEANTITNNTYAGYLQATFDATEELSLTAGVRRLVEHRKWGHEQSTPGRFGWVDATTPLVFNEAERFDRWTVLANAQYQLTDDMMTYATYSTGYKGGGFNGRVNETLPQTLEPVDPEKVYSYELGAKSSWFDRRLIANVALFYTDYEDIQQTVLSSASDGSFASVVENSGEATIRGAEIELKGRPTPELDLSAAFSWTDADYKDNKTFNSDGELVNFRDQPFYNTPQFTMNLSASYAIETPFGSIVPRLSWYHQSKVTYSTRIKSLTEQDTYGVLSGRLAWHLNDGQTQIALWGTNLLDRAYSDAAISFDDGFALADIFYAPPRLYGIEIIRDF